MKITYFLVGVFFLSFNLVQSQSDAISESSIMGSHTTEVKATLPAAYTNQTTTLSHETTAGEEEIAIQVDLSQVAIPMTSSAAPFENRPEGFGENLIYINGPFEDAPGLSILEESLNMDSYGFNVNKGDEWHMADDFVLHGTYDISSFEVYAYQTGSQAPSVTKAYVQIWDGDPSGNGTVIWGDTSTNRMASATATSIYRVSENDMGSTSREIQRVTVNTDGLNLDAGTYWIDVTLEGSASSGPWMPPISVSGETITGNALQLNSGNWQAVVDSGTGDPQGIPFEIYGTATDVCQEINPPYDWVFEDGYKVSGGSSTANDITIDAGTNFKLNNVVAYFMSDWPINTADIIYYDDNNGLPGSQIGSENNLNIVSTNAIGSAFNMSVYMVEFDVAPFEFEGQQNTDTTYWIQIKAENTGGSDTYWAGRFGNTVGYELANKGSGSWNHPRPDLDGVYLFSGDCEDILGVNNNAMTQFTVYPNPTSDFINIESAEQIEAIAMYNLLGQQVLAVDVNNSSTKLDISALQQGVYILKTTINGNENSVKIIKQ